MNALKLSWKNIRYRPWRSGLAILLMATGLSIVIVLLLTQGQMDREFRKNLSEIDLVVGAKGSPLQLVLSSVYHIDNPTGNIKEKHTSMITKNPFVEATIPMCIGDNYQSYRIIGTLPSYIDLYQGKIKEGRMWNQPMEVLIGANVQEKFDLKLGQLITGGHGIGQEALDEHDHAHDNAPYEVVGFLEPTGTVIDNLLLCEYRSSWIVHAGHKSEGSFELKFEGDSTLNITPDTLANDTIEHHHEEDEHNQNHDDHHHDEHAHHDHGHDHHGHDHHDHHGHGHSLKKVNVDSLLSLVNEEDKELTALLVKYNNPRAQLTLPNQINGKSLMMAADPDIELHNVLNLLDAGIQTATFMGYFVLLISAISVFIALYSSLKDRAYEIALTRVLGASRSKVFLMIIGEGLLLAFLGYIAALILSHVGMWVVAKILEQGYHYKFDAWSFSSVELALLGMALLIGLISAIIPAIKAYKTDISTTLSK